MLAGQNAAITAYITDMMDELARLSEKNGDEIGAVIVAECAAVLRRRNSLAFILRAAEADDPDPIEPV